MKNCLKKIICLVLGLCFVFSFVACDSNDKEDESAKNSSNQTNLKNSSIQVSVDGETSSSDNIDIGKNKVLIVYFTAEYNNTEKVATYIQSKIGGDLVKIEAEQPYTSQELNYNIKNNRPEVEKAQNARPEIANSTYDKIDMAKYDTVSIGYPIWWWTAPMIISTFLEHYDLSGKDIYPFTQSASMNNTHFTTSMEFVRECATKNGTPTVHYGLFASATSTSTIDNYLKNVYKN